MVGKEAVKRGSTSDGDLLDFVHAAVQLHPSDFEVRWAVHVMDVWHLMRVVALAVVVVVLVVVLVVAVTCARTCVAGGVFASAAGIRPRAPAFGEWKEAFQLGGTRTV